MYLVISEKMLSLGLKPIETMLLAQITSFKKDGCYMSVNTLKKMFNVSYNTIVRALDTLEKKNLIKRCGYTENKTVLYVSLFKEETKKENNQESKQDNKQDERKEEKEENTNNKMMYSMELKTRNNNNNSTSNIENYEDIFYDENEFY